METMVIICKYILILQGLCTYSFLDQLGPMEIGQDYRVISLSCDITIN